jgi:hypothetical protein
VPRTVLSQLRENGVCAVTLGWTSLTLSVGNSGFGVTHIATVRLENGGLSTSTAVIEGLRLRGSVGEGSGAIQAVRTVPSQRGVNGVVAGATGVGGTSLTLSVGSGSSSNETIFGKFPGSPLAGSPVTRNAEIDPPPRLR